MKTVRATYNGDDLVIVFKGTDTGDAVVDIYVESVAVCGYDLASPDLWLISDKLIDALMTRADNLEFTS